MQVNYGNHYNQNKMNTGSPNLFQTLGSGMQQLFGK